MAIRTFTCSDAERRLKPVKRVRALVGIDLSHAVMPKGV